MPTTMKLIAKNVLGSSASSVTFSSIVGTYTDLYLVASARTDRSGAAIDFVKFQFNGAGDANLSARRLFGDGTSASSTTDTELYLGYCPAATATSNTFGSGEAYIPNYAGSTNKSVSITGTMETNATDSRMAAIAGLWSNTAAITEIKLLPLIGPNFVSGSSFFLYGITKA